MAPKKNVKKDSGSDSKGKAKAKKSDDTEESDQVKVCFFLTVTHDPWTLPNSQPNVAQGSNIRKCQTYLMYAGASASFQ